MVSITLTEQTSIKDFEKMLDPEMDKIIKHFERELVAIRTNRAHTSMIEDLPVQCYGSTMRLKELAVLAAPDARLLTIQPWDHATVKDIEKAINSSDLGLTPMTDGALIRLQLPEVSGSRRDDLVKILHKKLEDARIGIRNVRKDIQSLVKETEKKRKISEDQSTRLLEQLQKSTDKFITMCDTIAARKERDIKG